MKYFFALVLLGVVLFIIFGSFVVISQDIIEGNFEVALSLLVTFAVIVGMFWSIDTLITKS